jgi:hypothetical protein
VIPMQDKPTAKLVTVNTGHEEERTAFVSGRRIDLAELEKALLSHGCPGGKGLRDEERRE